MALNEKTSEPSGDCQAEEFSFVNKGDLEKSLTCKVCERLLNVAPIMYSESLGSLCGRCYAAVSTNAIGPVHRQYACESLVKNFLFPCSNKSYGCAATIKFEDVQSHEKSCRFQCTNCPLTYHNLFPDKKCNWRGKSELLSEHLKVHQEEFLNPPQFEWLENGKNMIFFTNVGNQTIIAVIKHDRQSRFVCSLMLIGTDLESQCFRYQLELSDEDKNNSLLLRRNRLEPFSEFPDSLRQPEATLEVDIEKIAEFLQHPTKVFAKFGVVKKHKKEIIQLTGVKDGDILTGGVVSVGKEKSAFLDEEVLAELECPVCNEYMIPPIFICPTGHSVCNVCKSKVNICPTCRSNLGSGRNYTLEKLTMKVQYPCRNRDIGCGFVTTSDKIKQHQSTCNLTENLCILKCGWKGLFPAIYNHFLDNHKNQMIDVNVAIQKDLREDKNGCFNFLYAMGELFCLAYKNCGKSTVKFRMQHVGNVGSKPNFRYTIQFLMYPQQSWPCISITNFCENWTDNIISECFGHGCFTVPGELLRTCVYQTHSYYIKVNIIKL